MKKLTIKEIDKFRIKLESTEPDPDRYIQDTKIRVIAELNNICEQLEFMERSYMKIKEEKK